MTMPEQKVSPQFDHIADRFTEEQLDEMAKIPIGPRVSAEPRRRRDDEDNLTSNQKIEFVFCRGRFGDRTSGWSGEWLWYY